MGRSINTHNTIANMGDVARIQNVQQQHDETQRRQFLLALKEEAAHKENQVQNSHKTESTEIHKQPLKKDGKKNPKKRKYNNKQQDSDNEEQHIDLTI